MGAKDVKAVEYTCDNCGKSEVALARDEVNGYSGTVTAVFSGGGSTAKFFACSTDCLVPAIQAALFH
jgi:hypothetical protein